MADFSYFIKRWAQSVVKLWIYEKKLQFKQYFSKHFIHFLHVFAYHLLYGSAHWFTQNRQNQNAGWKKSQHLNAFICIKWKIGKKEFERFVTCMAC